jgi:hypothetical protein
VARVVRGVHERERAFPCPAAQGGEPRTLRSELLDVAASELLEPLRVMAEPTPQLRARSELALPGVELGVLA